MATQNMETVKHTISRREMLKLIAGSTAGAVLAACAPSTAPTSTAPSAGALGTPTEPVRIRFWQNSGGAQATWERFANMFHEIRPDIEVQVVFQGGGQEVFQKAQASLAAGDPPESSFVYPHVAPPLLESGVLVPLDSYIDDPEFNKEDFSEVLWANATWKDETFMVPKDYQPYVLYYRQDMFEEKGLTPPTNWSELEEAAIALTDEDKYGIDLMSSFLGPTNGWLSFLYNQGGNFVDPADPTKVVFNGPEGHAVMDFWNRLLNEHKVAPTAPVPSGFEAGKVAMQISGMWWMRGFYEQDIPFGIVEIPHEVRPLAHADMNGWAMWKTDPARQQAVWDWFKFFLSKEIFEIWVKELFYLPLRDSHKEDPDFQNWLSSSPELQHAIELPPSHFKGEPVTTAGAVSSQILWEGVEAGLYAQKPLRQALDDAASELQDLLV